MARNRTGQRTAQAKEERRNNCVDEDDDDDEKQKKMMMIMMKKMMKKKKRQKKQIGPERRDRAKTGKLNDIWESLAVEAQEHSTPCPPWQPRLSSSMPTFGAPSGPKNNSGR